MKHRQLFTRKSMMNSSIDDELVTRVVMTALQRHPLPHGLLQMPSAVASLVRTRLWFSSSDPGPYLDQIDWKLWKADDIDAISQALRAFGLDDTAAILGAGQSVDWEPADRWAKQLAAQFSAVTTVLANAIRNTPAAFATYVDSQTS